MPAIGGMGGANFGSVGSAYITIGANTLPFMASINAAGAAVKKFSASFAGIFAIGYALKKVTKEYADFDKQLKNTSTLINATGMEMRAIGNEVRSMARQYQIGATEAQTALYHIYSATIYGASAMNVLEEAAKGAAAGLASLGATSDMLTTVLNAYGMSANKTAEINDYLFTTIKFGKTTLSELASQFGRLAGVAAPVGASISDMTAAIATLTRQGIRTDWAITSLRQTLMQFIKPVKNLEEAIDDMGYSSGTAMIRQEGFAKSLKMVTAWAKTNNVEMSEMFTNVRAITAVLPLATTAAASYSMDLMRMSDSAGAASEAFEKQTKSLSYQMALFSTLFSDASISIGRLFVPALQAAMSMMSVIIVIFRKFSEILERIGGDWVLSAAASFGALTLSLKLLSAAMTKLGLVKAATSMASSFDLLTTKLGVMFRLIGAKSKLFSRFIKDTGTAFASGGSIGKFTAAAYSKSALISGMATAAIGIGAAAFSVKKIMEVEVKPIIKMGKVTGIENANEIFNSAISSILGGVVSGAVIGSHFGLPGAAAGAVIGGVTAGIAMTIKVLYEKAKSQDELDAPIIEDLTNRFMLEFDYPEEIGIGDRWNQVNEFLETIAYVPKGTDVAINDKILEFYKSWENVVREGSVVPVNRMTDDMLAIKKLFPNMAEIATIGIEEFKESLITAYKAAKIYDLTGGAPMPTPAELNAMDDESKKTWTDARNIRVDTINDEDFTTLVIDWAKENMDATVVGILEAAEQTKVDKKMMKSVVMSLINKSITGGDPTAMREAIANALESSIEGFSDDETLAFVYSNFGEFTDQVLERILMAAGQSIEEYHKFLSNIAITPYIGPEEEITIPPIIDQIRDDFYSVWDNMDDISTDKLSEKMRELDATLSGWEETVENLGKTGRATDSEVEGLNRELEILSIIMGRVTDDVKDMETAFRQMNLRTLDTDMSDLRNSIISDISNILNIASVPDVSSSQGNSFEAAIGEAQLYSGIAGTDGISTLQENLEVLQASAGEASMDVGTLSDLIGNFTTMKSSVEGLLEGLNQIDAYYKKDDNIEKLTQEAREFLDTTIANVKRFIDEFPETDIVLTMGEQIAAFGEIMNNSSESMAERISAESSLQSMYSSISESITHLAGGPLASLIPALELLIIELEKLGITSTNTADLVKDAQSDMVDAAIQGATDIAVALYNTTDNSEGAYSNTKKGLVASGANIVGSTISGAIVGSAAGPAGTAIGAAVGLFTAAIQGFSDFWVNLINDSDQKKEDEEALLFDTINSSINFLATNIDNLSRSFINLFTSTENYTNLQNELVTIQGMLFNAMTGFLSLIWGVLKIFIGEVEDMSTYTSDVATSMSETSDTMNSLNVPTGYKVERAMWRAATPGQPGDLKDNETNTDNETSVLEGIIEGEAKWLAAILQKFGDDIKKVAAKFNEFLEIMGGVWTSLGDVVIPAVLNSLGKFGDGLIALANHIKDDLLPIFSKHMPNIIENALDFFFSAITGIAKTFIDIFANIMPNLDTFSQVIGDIGDQLAGVFDAVTQALSPVINSLIEHVFTPLAEFIRDTLLPDFEAFLIGFGKWWKSDMEPFLQSDAFKALGDIAVELWEIFGELVEMLAPHIVPLLKKAAELIAKMWETLGPALRDLIQFIDDHWEEISEILLKKLEGWLQGLIDNVEKLKNALDISTWFSNFKDGLSNFWDNLMKDLGFRKRDDEDSLVVSSNSGAVTAPIEDVDTPAHEPSLPSVDTGRLIAQIIADHGGFGGVIGSTGEWVPYTTWNGVPVEHLSKGGGIMSDGSVVVHKGEVVVPARVSRMNFNGGGNQIIDNTIILDGDVLYNGMKRVNRQEQLNKTGSSIGGRAWNNA